MRFLKFDLYESGYVGFFNNLMSLELAVGLGVLSRRSLLIGAPQHAIFNSDKGLTVFDLVDVFYPHQVGQFDEVWGEYLPDLHANRLESTDALDQNPAPVLATCNASTLGYYSYTLPQDPRVTYACNYLLAIKEPYVRLARSIILELKQQYDRFASIHLRRKDFCSDHQQSRNVTCEEIRRNILCHVPEDWLLVIHSDETDVDYFRPIVERYPQHLMIDAMLFRQFVPHELDAAEVGVVSSLVACESDVFLGTMFSTFTGYIQRKRLLNGKTGGFLYLYNQRPDCLAFADGAILEDEISGPTWQRISMAADLRSICFWWREWPEAVYPA